MNFRAKNLDFDPKLDLQNHSKNNFDQFLWEKLKFFNFFLVFQIQNLLSNWVQKSFFLKFLKNKHAKFQPHSFNTLVGVQRQQNGQTYALRQKGLLYKGRQIKVCQVNFKTI